MNSVAVTLIVVSLVVLALAFMTWRLITSKSVIFFGLFGSVGVLFAAYFAATHDARNAPLTYLIPFMLAMAFLGRGGGLFTRVKKEPELKTPAIYLFAAGAVSLVGCVVAYAGQ